MTKMIHGWGPAAALALFLCAGGAAAQDHERSYYVLDVMDDLRQEIAWRQRDAPSNEGGRAYYAEMSFLAPAGMRDVVVSRPESEDTVLSVVAYCDQDCDALRLTVFEDLAQIDTRDGRDRVAVTFDHRRGHTYTVRIGMEDCDADICFFALGAFQR
jgi:hypothetical protein